MEKKKLSQELSVFLHKFTGVIQVDFSPINLDTPEKPFTHNLVLEIVFLAVASYVLQMDISEWSKTTEGLFKFLSHIFEYKAELLEDTALIEKLNNYTETKEKIIDLIYFITMKIISCRHLNNHYGSRSSWDGFIINVAQYMKHSLILYELITDNENKFTLTQIFSRNFGKRGQTVIIRNTRNKQFNLLLTKYECEKITFEIPKIEQENLKLIKSTIPKEITEISEKSLMVNLDFFTNFEAERYKIEIENKNERNLLKDVQISLAVLYEEISALAADVVMLKNLEEQNKITEKDENNETKFVKEVKEKSLKIQMKIDKIHDKFQELCDKISNLKSIDKEPLLMEMKTLLGILYQKYIIEIMPIQKESPNMLIKPETPNSEASTGPNSSVSTKQNSAASESTPFSVKTLKLVCNDSNEICVFCKKKCDRDITYFPADCGHYMHRQCLAT